MRFEKNNEKKIGEYIEIANTFLPYSDINQAVSIASMKGTQSVLETIHFYFLKSKDKPVRTIYRKYLEDLGQ